MSKNKKQYNARFFKENTPEWKRKKDSLLLKIFYRPVSFYISALLSNFGISANSVSYFSVIIAIISCVCFVLGIKLIAIVGAILIHIWLLLDCVDGNIARCVKKQPFGEFADAMSSYILVALLPLTLGIYVFLNGGFLFSQGNILIIIIGAVASESDTLMRLIFQKYKNCELDLINNGTIKVQDNGRRKEIDCDGIKVRIEMELGLAGIIPLLVLLSIIFDIADLTIMYCLFYYFGSCLLSTIIHVNKAIKYSKQGE